MFSTLQGKVKERARHASRLKRKAEAPVALDGSIVTMKSAPAAHSLADAAAEPPAAASLDMASALTSDGVTRDANENTAHTGT